MKHGSGVEDFVVEEMKVCSRIAEVYSRNYYAWTHRIWVLKMCGKNEVCEIRFRVV